MDEVKTEDVVATPTEEVSEDAVIPEVDEVVSGLVDNTPEGTEAPQDEVKAEDAPEEESASLPALEVKIYARKRVASFDGTMLTLESGETVPLSQEEYDLLSVA